MNNVPFTLSQVRPIRDAMTVSRPFRTGLWSAGNMVFLGRRHFYYPGIL